MVKDTKDIVKKQDNALATSMQDMGFDASNNFLGGVKPRLQQIGIIHQGQMFKDTDDKKIGEFTAHIIHYQPSNAYWKVSFAESGAGTPPDCASIDGIKPDQGDDKQSPTCAECKQNQWGSAEGGGKACKNMIRLHILREGQALPVRITLPPSNIKPFESYLTQLTTEGCAYQLAKTEFSLTPVTNKGGIEYSEVVLKKTGKIEDIEAATMIKDMITKFSASFSEEIDMEEMQNKKEAVDSKLGF